MKNKIAVGIDIGGTNAELGWVNKDGKVLHRQIFKTADFTEIEQMVETIGNAINAQIKNLDHYEILGLGIGAPNGNFYKGTIEFAPNLHWKGVLPLAEMFAKKTGLTTKLTNDANAAAYAEHIYGAAKEMNNFLVVTLGTGLGSGIVVNGNVLYGATGFAGEMGHTKTMDNGRQCGCGRLGCLETYVSATGLARTTVELLAQSRQISVLRDKEKITSEDVFLAASSGDELALKAIKYTTTIFGKHLADYVALFSPEAIFLTGGLANAHSLLIPHTEEVMNQSVLKVFTNTVKIYPSALLKENAGLIGAAAMLFDID